MKKVLFIDRDGTLVQEPPVDYQLDSLEKLSFIPGVFRYLSLIQEELNYELVMVTNQDGLGTPAFPEATFWPAHNKMMEALKNENIEFADVLIDRSFPEDMAPTRKPKTGLLGKYMQEDYDLGQSFVIGDRLTDIELAENLGAKGILLSGDEELHYKNETQVLKCDHWKSIYEFLHAQNYKASVQRTTKETDIKIDLKLYGTGVSNIRTGLSFFDHMLEQIAKHALVDLKLICNGDLEVDEHHTIEDVALALGQAFKLAFGDKLGMERYGFMLPMDDCLTQVALDFGGRPWLIWDAQFNREKIGDMPTEMFMHFFKSFSDAAQCNLNIKAEGNNEHHKIESIFKGLAKAIKMAKQKDLKNRVLPSTKGVL